MKSVLFTALVIITLGVAWVLYLRWDTKHFVENLPKAPSQTKIEHTVEGIAQEEPAENENSELPSEFTIQQESTDVGSEGIRPDLVPRFPHYSKTQPRDSPITYHSEQHEVYLGDTDEYLEQDLEENIRRSFRDLSVAEIIENNRQLFRKKHGNIPEIDIYLRLNASFYEGLKDGKTEIITERTPEESLEFRRVTAVLFPTEGNKKAYREELKKMKELGVIK